MSAFPEPSLLDGRRIEELRSLGRRTGRDLLASLATLFRQSSAEHLEELQRAFATLDADVAQRAAHTLKSSAGNIGAGELAELARQIEEAGRAGRIEEARPYFERLERQLPQVVGELDRLAAG